MPHVKYKVVVKITYSLLQCIISASEATRHVSSGVRDQSVREAKKEASERPISNVDMIVVLIYGKSGKIVYNDSKQQFTSYINPSYSFPTRIHK